jgi:hypothetical protein
VSVTGTLVEDKMRRIKGECEHFSFNKCPIYTHDGASAKFSTNYSREKDNSAVPHCTAGAQGTCQAERLLFLASLSTGSAFLLGENQSLSENK